MVADSRSNDCLSFVIGYLNWGLHKLFEMVLTLIKWLLKLFKWLLKLFEWLLKLFK